MARRPQEVKQQSHCDSEIIVIYSIVMNEAPNGVFSVFD